MTTDFGLEADSAGDGTDGLSHREVMAVLSGMLIALFLAAIDSTIVSTALPTMAGELGSVDQLPWVLTAYLLTSTATTPLWGKFSDLWGRVNCSKQRSSGTSWLRH